MCSDRIIGELNMLQVSSTSIQSQTFIQVFSYAGNAGTEKINSR
jgi:hypothetical protein